MIKNEWILFTIFFILIVLPNSFWFISKLLEQRTVNFKLLEFNNVFYLPQETKAHQKSKTKHILLYTSWFTQDDWYFGLGSKPFKGCPQANCIIRNHGRVERAHAVLFHARNFKIKVGQGWSKDWCWKRPDPGRRRRGQVYVMVNKESPVYDAHEKWARWELALPE